DRAKTFFHGHSYTANPLACAVALASLELFDSEGVLGRVMALEEQLRGWLSRIRTLACVGDTRLIGGVAAIELVSDRNSRAAGGYLDGVGPRLSEAFIQRGLLLRPLGNVLYFVPPYVIKDHEVDWAFEQITDVLHGL